MNYKKSKEIINKRKERNKNRKLIKDTLFVYGIDFDIKKNDRIKRMNQGGINFDL